MMLAFHLLQASLDGKSYSTGYEKPARIFLHERSKAFIRK